MPWLPEGSPPTAAPLYDPGSGRTSLRCSQNTWLVAVYMPLPTPVSRSHCRRRRPSSVIATCRGSAAAACTGTMPRPGIITMVVVALLAGAAPGVGGRVIPVTRATQ
jgi:hypothetical protein